MSVIYVAVPPHTTLRLKGRLRCEVLRTEARCVEQHVWFCVLETAYSEQPSCVLGIAYMLCKLMLLLLSVRYPHQLDMTYPPPLKGVRRVVISKPHALSPLVVACGFVTFCFLYLLILTVVASAYSSRSTRNASAASLDGLAPANVAMQRARWRTKLRAVGG